MLFFIIHNKKKNQSFLDPDEMNATNLSVTPPFRSNLRKTWVGLNYCRTLGLVQARCTADSSPSELCCAFRLVQVWYISHSQTSTPALGFFANWPLTMRLVEFNFFGLGIMIFHFCYAALRRQKRHKRGSSNCTVSEMWLIIWFKKKNVFNH